MRFSSFQDMKYNSNIINTSTQADSSFIYVWDIIYPKSRTVSMNAQLFSYIKNGLFKSEIENCFCDELGYTAWSNKEFSFRFNNEKELGQYWQFGFGIELNSTPEKCFNFWLQHNILWNGNYLKNVNELSLLCLQKELEKLNTQEIIKLICYRKLGSIQSRDSSAFTKEYNYLLSVYKKNGGN